MAENTMLIGTGQSTVGTDKVKSIQDLEKELTTQLNYGGIFVNGQCNAGHIEMAYEMGDLNDEVGQMRRLASAFTNLANALEQS